MLPLLPSPWEHIFCDPSITPTEAGLPSQRCPDPFLTPLSHFFTSLLLQSLLLGLQEAPSLPHPSHGIFLVPHPFPRHISRPTHSFSKSRGPTQSLAKGVRNKQECKYQQSRVCGMMLTVLLKPSNVVYPYHPNSGR